MTNSTAINTVSETLGMSAEDARIVLERFNLDLDELHGVINGVYTIEAFDYAPGMEGYRLTCSCGYYELTNGDPEWVETFSGS